jgi:hypothetical protein
MENPHVACLKNNSQGGMWIEASKVAQWLKYSVFFKMYIYAEVRTTAQSVRAQGKRTC